jgi:NAD(P)-dependent dehydrogenase (short-subunit alcohol dehydrogenase family)
MLQGKSAVITGASSGIGRELGLQLAAQGVSVVLAARRLELLNGVVEAVRSAGGKAEAVKCDVTKRPEAEEAVHRCVRSFGRIDILVNNAGRGHLSSVEDTTDEMIESMFRLNVFALWYTVRPALRLMKQQGSGHIINMASMAGKLGYPFNSAYVAAKHAVVGFTHALRMELAETGIHASVVCPAGVLTSWASMTEGKPMLPFFSESGPEIKRIARERGSGLPPIEGVMPPARVAAKIVECILNPVPEVYTHEGSEEFVRLAATDRARAEACQIPVVLGERRAYERSIRKDPG